MIACIQNEAGCLTKIYCQKKKHQIERLKRFEILARKYERKNNMLKYKGPTVKNKTRNPLVENNGTKITLFGVNSNFCVCFFSYDAKPPLFVIARPL